MINGVYAIAACGERWVFCWLEVDDDNGEIVGDQQLENEFEHLAVELIAAYIN